MIFTLLTGYLFPSLLKSENIFSKTSLEAPIHTKIKPKSWIGKIKQQKCGVFRLREHRHTDIYKHIDGRSDGKVKPE